MKLASYWMKFVGIWEILGFLVFIPPSWNVSDISNWSAPVGGVEEKFAYFTTTQLAVLFLVMGVLMLWFSKNPLKYWNFIVLGSIFHFSVYVLNIYSVLQGLNTQAVLYITQVDLVIVALGIVSLRKVRVLLHDSQA